MSNKMYMQDGKLVVPDHVVIPFIEGDGVGAEITPVCQKIVNTAVELAYVGKRRIEWKEVLAGGKAFEQTGEWLPKATLEAFKEYLVGIKGPLTTPVGGGIRSLNVALRQTLDLYVSWGRICKSEGEKQMDFQEWFDLYLSTYKRDIKPRTREEYQRQHRIYIAPIIGAKPP